jgi:hypothetical protein
MGQHRAGRAACGLLNTIAGHGWLKALAGGRGAADCAIHRAATVFKIAPSLVR